MAKISLVIDQSHSLKEKRMVLRRIRDRVRERLHVTVNEVGEHDNWQRAELGTAVVSADRGNPTARSSSGAPSRVMPRGRYQQPVPPVPLPTTWT